jgi:hypothetical protein
MQHREDRNHQMKIRLLPSTLANGDELVPVISFFHLVMKASSYQKPFPSLTA